MVIPSLKVIYRNTPNIVSMLGVVPLVALLFDDGFSYFLALVFFNNVMDDLDGILARELSLSSEFGARLDNVCDAVAHILIVMVIGAHYGGVVLAFCAPAVVAILVRVVNRLGPEPASGMGTPTNELMRHLLLIVILQDSFEVDVAVFLTVTLVLNSASMLVPFSMPQLVRARTRSVAAIVGVNIALAVAWGVPTAAPFVAAVFFGTYLYSFVVGGVQWTRDQA